MRLRFPIRYKFLAVTTLLLVFCVVSYLALASHIFRTDKIELVFDLNRGAVSGLAGDVSTLFAGIGDKMKLAGRLSQERDAKSRALLKDLLESDSNIVYLYVSYGFKGPDETFFSDATFSQTYALDAAYFNSRLPQSRPVPYAEIQTEGEAVWNATLPDGPPLIGFGKSIMIQSSGDGATERAPFAMVAFVRADKILEAFQSSRLNEVMALNQHGQVLVHQTPELMTKAADLSAHPLLRNALKLPVRVGVLRFEDGGRELLGAHATAQNGRIFVLSQIDGLLAFSAVENLVKRSLVFAMIAITLAFIAAVFFSRSLTRPIHTLVEATKQVARGDLSPKIEVSTHDEIAHLAQSFSSMLGDLHASRSRLEEANRDLESKVKDRTRQLEEQNLAVKKTQEALLQTTRLATVGEVAGRAAHEILNPLTSLMTRLERVRARVQQASVPELQLVQGIVKAWEDDVQNGGFERLVENWKSTSALDEKKTLWQEDLENLNHSGSALLTEIVDVIADLDFLLKESGRINKIVQKMRTLTRVRGELRPASAHLLLKDAIRVMSDLAQDHGIEIRESFSAEHDQVRVDGDEFIQVMTNLIRNSIQAVLSRHPSPSSPRWISLATSCDERGFQIELADNGIGINPEDQQKLFEVQFSTKPSGEGTGLGLSISRRFIRDFGGDIELVRSAPQDGCTFAIRLPMANASIDEKGIAA